MRLGEQKNWKNWLLITANKILWPQIIFLDFGRIYSRLFYSRRISKFLEPPDGRGSLHRSDISDKSCVRVNANQVLLALVVHS